MKTTKNFRRVCWLIACTVVFLMGLWEAVFYVRVMKPRFATRDWAYILGYCAGRRVHVYTIAPEDQNVAHSGFAVKIDDNLVYMELDDNGDDVADSLVHYDGGRETYITQRVQGAPHTWRKQVQYYDEEGRERFLLYDSQGDGSFFQRLRWVTSNEVVRETYKSGEWRRIESEEEK